MCPLKREQATRVSYNTLTEKVGHELSTCSNVLLAVDYLLISSVFI